MFRFATCLVCKHEVRTGLRFASSKILRPHPRSHKRRLFEATLKPKISPELYKKKMMLEQSDVYDFLDPPLAENELSEYETAEVAMIRNWIKENQFRVFGVCQLLYVKESPRWLAQNQFRLKGFEFKQYSPKTMCNVFKGTPFEVLNMLYDDNTIFLFGKNSESLRTLFKECENYKWLTLLAGALDNRILSVNTLKQFSKLSSLDEIRAETAQVLDQIPQSFLQSLDSTSRCLVNTFNHMQKKN